MISQRLKSKPGFGVTQQLATLKDFDVSIGVPLLCAVCRAMALAK